MLPEKWKADGPNVCIISKYQILHQHGIPKDKSPKVGLKKGSSNYLQSASEWLSPNREPSQPDNVWFNLATNMLASHSAADQRSYWAYSLSCLLQEICALRGPTFCIKLACQVTTAVCNRLYGFPYSRRICLLTWALKPISFYIAQRSRISEDYFSRYTFNIWKTCLCYERFIVLKKDGRWNQKNANLCEPSLWRTF